MVAFAESLEYSTLDDSDKRKEFFKKIVTAILSYHILPSPLAVHQLTENTTYATNLSLSDGSLGGQPLRINVHSSVLPPSLSINLYSKVLRHDIRATNGPLCVISTIRFHG